MEGDKESSASPAWFLNGAEGIVASYKANIKTKRCEMNSRELEMIVESKFNELGNVTSNSPRSKRIVYECNDSNFMQTKSILQHDNNKRRDKTLALLTQQLSLEDTERLLTQDKCNVTTYQGIALDKWHQEHETFKPGVSHQWGQRSRERQSEAQSETKSSSESNHKFSMGEHAWIEDVYIDHKDYLDKGGAPMSFYTGILENAGRTGVMSLQSFYQYIRELRDPLTQLQKNLIGRANFHGGKDLGSHVLIEEKGAEMKREITIAFYTLFFIFEKDILQSNNIAVLGSPLHIFTAISILFGMPFAQKMFKLLDGSAYPKYYTRDSNIYAFVNNICAAAQGNKYPDVTSIITLVAEIYNITKEYPDSKIRAKKEEIEKAKANIRAIDDPSQIPTFTLHETFQVLFEQESSNVLTYAIYTAFEDKLVPLRQAQQQNRDITFQELFGTREDFFNLLGRKLGPFMRDVILLKCSSSTLNLKATMNTISCRLCNTIRNSLYNDMNKLVVQLERVKVWNDAERFDIFHVQDKKDQPKSLHIFKAVAEKFNLLDNFEDERESIEKARKDALMPVFPMQAIGTFHKIRKRDDSQELHLHIYKTFVPKLPQIVTAVRNNQKLTLHQLVGQPKEVVALFREIVKPDMTDRILKAFNKSTTVHSAIYKCILCQSIDKMLKRNLPKLADILREVRDYVNSSTEKVPVSQDSTQPISIKDSFASSDSLMNEDESQVHEDEDEETEKKMAAKEVVEHTMHPNVSENAKEVVEHTIHPNVSENAKEAIKGEKWKCNSCTFLNSMDDPKCAICNIGKKAKMSVPSPDDIKGEKWKCNSCTFLNSMDDPKCAICNIGKKAKMSVPSPDDIKGEKWKCNSCTFLNSMDDPKCAICNNGKKAKMSPTFANSVSMSPTLPVPLSNVDCSEKSDKCSVIELDTSSEEEESEKEESDEEYVEVDETIPTSTIHRQSKRLRTVNPVIKIENLREGVVKCPVCKVIIVTADRGCNIIACRNHRPQFVYFCIHCKTVNTNGVVLARE